MTAATDAGAGPQLSNPEKRLLMALQGAKDWISLDDRVRFPNDAEAARAASWLEAKGLVESKEDVTRTVSLDAEGQRYARDGLPEARLHAWLAARGPQRLSELGGRDGLTKDEVQIALRWWKRKQLGDLVRDGAETMVHAAPRRGPSPDEKVLATLGAAAEVPAADLDAAGLELLKGRQGVVRVHERRSRRLRLTSPGRAVAEAGLTVEEELGQLTPELIRSGAWKGKALRAYDVATPAPRTHAGKPHPLVQLIEEIRDIFVELGFQEIEEEYVVSTLWNMDALFIPQDHPAREMQDTFYLDDPSRLPVDSKFVDLVRGVHESGGGTGSRGWGGRFDPSESARALLRTHTTVGTVRHLSRHPADPVRVFSIGRVFRKETMDATHLPEFHQIEGIATEPGADFRMLLGILQEFYKRLGFEKLRWRPAFFPYTEPSMEVEVWTGTRWMELGGCGIFRPEVTQPLGVKTPVLAWGLGLERLAMLRFGLKDIRDIYISDIEWLRRQPLL